MDRFDKRGRLNIPDCDSVKEEAPLSTVVAKELYCPNDHQLVSQRSIFDDHPGIVLIVRNADGEEGTVALSPVFGDKRRMVVDLELERGEVVSLHCPRCDAELPVHSACDCGGDLVAMFLAPGADFANCIGICNRVDCEQARITGCSELLARAAQSGY